MAKRLLVDDEREVPEWLTISARRETFERNEAEALGLIIRDTPGVAGGNQEHEATACDALLLTDAVVMVLPPQLITGDREAITSVLDGSHFHCTPDSAFAPGGLVIALTRMDEAGVMPNIDPAGYAELIQRKRRELSAILAAAKVDESRLTIHALAADPDGMVGSAQDATPQTYNSGRAWDGMVDIVTTLRALTQRKAELLVWGERRFLRFHLGNSCRSLEDVAQQTRIASEAATNEAEAHGLALARLKALLGGARSDLEHRIGEEVASASRRSGADHSIVLEILTNRMNSTLDRWWQAQDAALDSFAAETDAEVKQRHERPDWQSIFDLLFEEEEPETNDAVKAPPPKSRRDEILRMNKIIQKAFREAMPHALDMPLEKARVELQQLKQAGSFQEYAKQSARRAGRLSDPAHAEQARRALLIDAGFAVAVPALLEIGGVIGEMQADAKAAQERIDKRAKLQADVDTLSHKLAERAWTLWHDEGMPASLSTTLREVHANASSKAEALILRLKAVADTLDRLRTLLGVSPS